MSTIPTAHENRRPPAWTVLKWLGIGAIAAAVLACFLVGVSNVRGGAEGEGRQQLEESIRRTAAACYAAEGIYPPSVEYMQEKYGLQVDENRYYVDYILFADNLMPDFTVLDVSESGKGGSGSGSASAQAQSQAQGGDTGDTQVFDSGDPTSQLGAS